MPTEAGARLLERFEPAMREISDALADLQGYQQMPVGPVRLSVPPPAARLIFAPRLGAFAARHPRVQVEIVSDDRLIDIVREGFDAGVRYGESLAADMIAVPIGSPQRLVVVGSPSYLADYGRPEQPQDLTRHRCIERRFTSGNLYQWEFEKDDRAVAIAVSGSVTTDDDDVMVRAAIDGAGLAYVYEEQVREAVVAGALATVLEDWYIPPAYFFIYYASRRQLAPALRAVVDFFRAPRG
ncbi:LysR substrate-binding domain-containing protein [Aureimonas ureilytica]|nr:LysR substrate-binding domain-containing protein [Aureimonas ureilytica]